MNVCRHTVLALTLIAGCKTAPPPPLPPPPPITLAKPPPPPVSPAACRPTVATCLERAEDTAEVRLDEAIAIAAECVSCPNAPPNAFRLQANLQSDAGHVVDARESLLAGVARYPEHALLWLTLGRLELAAKRPREAIGALARAHRLRPEDENVEDEYQHALARHGTKAEKIEARAQPLLMEAIGRYELDDIAGAQKVLESALKAAAGVPRITAEIRHRLGLIALGKGEAAAAKHHFEVGLQLAKDPSSLRVALLVSYAELLLATNKPDEAIDAARAALAIDDNNALAHTNLAVALVTNGDPDAGLVALTRASKVGLARRLTRRQFEAIEVFKGLAEDPRYQAWLLSTWPSR